MKKNVALQTSAILMIALIFATCKKNPADCDCLNGPEVTVSVFTNGLNNPRGLKFGPDGNLYVAEAGRGGTNSTVGQCTQVDFPIGPYTGSPTGGRISKINSSGMRSTITDKLPSSKANEIVGGSIEGVSDVAFIGNTLYALLAGAGCSHGVANIPNGVVRVTPDGSWSLVANISAYLQAHPVAHPEPGDFEPDGSPYSMVVVDGIFYALEPNHGELMKIRTNGNITRVVDISATQGHIVPTAVVYHNGYFYVGNLNLFPIVEGSSNIYKISPSGEVQIAATGFTTILGLTFDKKDRLYVLENTAANAPSPLPNMGRIVRVNPSGSREVITTKLSLPTAITYGPDNNLYVSNIGFGPAALGGGQVLKIAIKDCDCDNGRSLGLK